MSQHPPILPRTLAVMGLSLVRGERVLFENLDLELRPGDGAQLRGPNGAGKTSLLMCLAGVLTPSAGKVVIGGGDGEARPETDIGFLPHLSGLKPRLTVMENLAFWAALNGVSRAGAVGALELVGLAPIATLEAGHLSAGQSRRLALARLVMAERAVWLLDEPMAALDARGEALVAHLIERQLDLGGVVVAATHHDFPLEMPGRLATIGLGHS